MKYILTFVSIALFSLQLFSQSNVSNAAKTSPSSATNAIEKEETEEELLDVDNELEVLDEVKQDQKNQQQATYFLDQYQTERSKYYNAYDRSISSTQQQKLDEILVKMQKSVPNSFEYNYAMYVNSNFDIQEVKYLNNAYAIAPERPETYDDFMAYYELTDDLNNRRNFSKKLYNSNTISSEIMAYNYNVLMSVDQDAVLFTNGDSDTYPLWVWQDVNAVRTDVAVLNYNLINKQYYLEQKERSLSLEFPSSSLLETSPALFYNKFCTMNPTRPIYFALTLAPSYLNKLTEYLYVTGLTYKFSMQDFDNASTTYKNWNKKFKTEYIINKQYYSQVQMNYLIPLLIMYDYETNGVKKQTLLHLINDIAKKYNKEKEVEQYISR